MPVPRRRHSKRRSAARRTHEKLFAKQVAVCKSCGEPKMPHRICPHCGSYRGRSYKTTVTK
jgi:large subunit ribosomal protein L32